MKFFLSSISFFLLISSTTVFAQQDDTNIVLITLDGFRWQELFTGADSLLVANTQYVQDTAALKESFWKESAEERREALLPFIWSDVVSMGQIHGNRIYGNKMDLTNSMWFSYPGYNEILTGRADDDHITSNDKIPNPNITVLELANKDARFKNRVVAFGSWDVFPYIINESRSEVKVNAGFDRAIGENLSEKELFLNELQTEIPSPWGSVRLDAFTHHFALEEMKKNHPKLIYIAYGETDDFAHDGDYEAYLKSAHNTDSFIKELWRYTQSDPFYRNNTLFIITTDHGRGTIPIDTWKSHGNNIQGSGSVWLIVFGKGVITKGEVINKGQMFSNQIAPTILKVLKVSSDTSTKKGEEMNLN
ncbi:sulfatase-like hydrolase/transferase [Maribacter sp. PR1]|uniref:Sulfatase-like hydrolase/transferase n=1 Tax=Maribacter cobaltidurans TaxID=1178778 RepID=A0ABU7INK6_9FLAO|nr:MULTISPECIES: sulfatase-like hydrolase/transferase [Maribacter]MDC6387144.1 sulfatase-like hydrolase/transferase [Maribacter sp. PR1]MEE1974530.1 sulfatase-like hydrolase/transferase [Maribacter cobaltidurans]